MGKLLGIRAYARERGVNHSAVQKAIRLGRLRRSLSKDAKGRVQIDPAIADEEWRENTDRAQQRGGAAGRGTEAAPQANDFEAAPGENVPPVARAGVSSAPFLPSAGEHLGAPTGAPSYSQSRAVREAFLAKTARVRYEMLVGSVVRADEVRDQAFKTYRIVRDALLGLPSRIAPELAATDSPFEVHRILTRELTAALAGLVDEGRRN